MALITCPDCKVSISSAAKSCPQCGRPVAVVMTAAGPITPLQHELAKTAKSGMESCGGCCLGIGILVSMPILVPLLVVGVAVPFDWAQENPVLAGCISVVIVGAGIVLWRKRDAVRSFFKEAFRL